MLQNNSTSMATVVETFLVEETINLIHDGEALQKWNDKVEELGLQGQREVVIVKDKSPIPFLWMNSGLVATFEVLCPTKVNIDQYNKTPIPLEILDLVGLSKKEGYFDTMQIWYNETDKDPVCIGIVLPEEYKQKESWYHNIYGQKYLIGRWADVKASLDSLTEKARKIFAATSVSQLKQTIRNAQREIEDIEETANRKFGNAMPSTDNLPF